MPPEEKWWVVLADFGISKRADERNGTTSAVKGTTAFMAPELLGFLDRTRHNFTLDPKAADMWALGEIIFRMLTGEAAFQTPGELMTYCMGLRDFPSNRLPMSAVDKIYEFVTNLMMVLPQDRSTTAQCIQHCWMESLVEAEFGALNLEQSELPVTQVSSAEETSARWSSLSNSNYESTQTGIKDRTLRITRKAGPPGNVSPVPDFEAAAVAVLGERMEDGEPLQITDCFIVCSAGAVTVELMSYMIRALQPPQIEERVIRDSMCIPASICYWTKMNNRSVFLLSIHRYSLREVY
jgi:serine/threonine protein kinase